MKTTFWTLLALVTLLALPATLPAQLGGQTSGAFGTRNLGGSINNPTTGFSGTNQSYSAGVGAASGAASNGSATSSAATGAGQVSAGDRFVRGSRQPGQFVGGDSGEARAVGQQNSQATQGMGQNGLGGGLGQSGRNGGLGGGLGGGGLGGGLGGNNRNGRGGTSQLGGLFGANSDFGGGQAQQKPFRAPLALGFEMPKAARMVKLNTHFQTRLTKIPALKVTGPLEVRMEGETAVLRGQVATERDRDLAARLARLEPGISAVRNELVVAPKVAVPAAEAIPTPAAETVLPPPVDR